MIFSVLWFIFCFIFGFGLSYIVLNKKIKRLKNVLKSQSDGFVKNYNLFFQTVSKRYGDENYSLKCENKYLYDQNCELRHKLSDFYKSDEFIKINRKIKKYKKKVKKMYKLLPEYNKIINTFTFIKDKF